MPRRYKMKTRPTDRQNDWTKKRDRAMTEFAEFKPAEKFRRDTPEYASLQTTADPHECARASEKRYTGTYIKGIAQTHKSNAVPVVDSDHIVDIARMRR